jgi:pyruvate dehydrogenase E2 component (dihydrolipoamide acetyltransferase)
MAQERGIDLSLVKGTGPGGRIVKRDIEGYRAPVGLPVVALVTEKIPVSGKRKIAAQRLAESKFQAPHYYLKLSIAMDGLMEARKRLNERRDEKVSLNAYIIKFVAEALKKHPMVNAGWQGEYIQKFGSVDVGLAVAVADGLITPVVRDCGNKGVLEIEEDLKLLIPRARDGKLQPEEYQNATFTVTNLGSYGIEDFTAIINPPGSAILALGMIQKRQVVITEKSGEDTLKIQSLMKVSLSCDHRVVDGATGASFLSELKNMMENPIEALY